MKFSNILSLVVIATATTSALSIDLLGAQKPVVSIAEDKEIPGDSPLKLCSEKPEKDTVLINKVNLKPNPPLPGQNLTIEATGEVLETIENGTYIHVVVRLGPYIKLLDKTFDFCEEIVNVNLSCPVKKGTVSITKEVQLPAAIPPGKYSVQADLFSAKNDPLTCLKADVVFKIRN